MSSKRLKRPRYPVQLGKLIGDILTGQIADTPTSAPADHAHMMAIYLMRYNFVRLHQTLMATPAMAAGVTPKLWKMSGMVKVFEGWAEA